MQRKRKQPLASLRKNPLSDPPLLLYSVNTWLAFAIAERFYKGTNYAWCSRVFDGQKAQAHVSIPPTSSPADIYRGLLEEVNRKDFHSGAIERNRVGLLKGAEVKRAAGVIDAKTQAAIAAIVKSATLSDFRPLLYIIPFEKVAEVLYRGACSREGTSYVRRV